MSSSPRLLARLSPPQFLLLAACATLASAAGADVTVTADLAGTTTLATKFMLDCVGASHGEMYMWEDNRNHLRAIARDIGCASSSMSMRAGSHSRAMRASAGT